MLRQRLDFGPQRGVGTMLVQPAAPRFGIQISDFVEEPLKLGAQAESSL